MTETFEAIVCPAEGENLRNSEGSVIERADGSLLLAYTRFRAGNSSDFAPADIATRVSSDGGRTWSGDAIIAKGDDASGTLVSASLLRLRKGGIALFFYRSTFQKGKGFTTGNMDDVTMPTSRLIMMVSEDEGKTWSDERDISFAGESSTALLNDTAVRLSTGRILLPAYHGLSPYSMGDPEFVQFHMSDDDGRSWFRNAFRLVPSDWQATRGLSESSVVERADGSLLMMSRTAAGSVYRCESSDGGESWTAPRSSGLPASGTPTSLLRIPGSNDLLLIWNQVSQREWSWGFGRHRLTAAVSSDGGETWKHRRNLESLDDRTDIPTEEGGPAQVADRVVGPEARARKISEISGGKRDVVVAEYSSLTFVNGHAVITYDAVRHGEPGCSLKLRVLPIDWFYEEE